jgi:glycosyltransferase involved in cell wall biosynthesis
LVKLIYRKKKIGFNSIENVFDALLPYLGENIEKIELPYESSGLINRIKNILFVRKIAKNSIIHITGHDHYLALGLRKKNTILTIHDVEFIKRNKGLKKILLQKLWMDYPIKRVEMVTTISEFSKKEILNIGHYKTPIIVINDPLTLTIKETSNTFNTVCPNILHIGTKPNKNLPNLIKALSGINCHLTIVGELTPSLIDLLITNNINYTSKSNLSNKEIVEEYEHCDLLAFVSIYEGFGLPIIEAQAMGRAVITSDAASMPEVAGDGAYIVNPFDVNEIKKGILELINNVELREQLIKNGLENVKRFDPQKIAEQYLKLYKEVMNEQNN